MIEDNSNSLNQTEETSTIYFSPTLPPAEIGGELSAPSDTPSTNSSSPLLPPFNSLPSAQTGVELPPAIDRGETRSLWGEVRAFARDLLVAVLIAVLVIVFIVQPVRVEGTSMLPRLHDGERVFVNKFVYKFESINRGDVVVFWYPNDPSKSFIKRVIGLPGETVSIRDGIVYVNGEPLDEPYLDSSFHAQRDSLSPVYVKPHYYFVMGDNRDASNDSRQWGLVPEKYIYGKAIFRYWPLGNVGMVN